MDNRIEALKAWTGRSLGATTFDFRPASSDASFRRYFRVTLGTRRLIAMDAPPDKMSLTPYVTIAERFREIGLNVPEVLAANYEDGFLLITDLGEQLYLGSLNDRTVARLYGDALGALIVLQSGRGSGADPFLPDYDEELLRRELEIFREWYLGVHRGFKLTPGQNRLLDEVFTLLAQSALSQPRVWVHRDYHSRNLLVTQTNNPGILDFQDAVFGPVTYDLVSLLRDCYIAWPRERVEEWVMDYLALARPSGIPVGADEARFLYWFDLMGVQRHLKAAGIFARLKHRDGKPGYVDDIPRTLGYVQAVSARYPALEPLNTLWRELKLPGAT